MKYCLYFILTLVIICNGNTNILSTMDFTNLQTSTNFFPKNFAGVSIDFSQVYLSAMNSTLFQAYIGNSKAYSSNYAQFSLSLKFPKGYKYNCSSYPATSTCTYAFQGILSRISAFIRNSAPTSFQNFAVGFDMQGADFTNPAFLTYFSSYGSALTSGVRTYYNVPFELIYEADTFAANNITQNYTTQKYISDMQAAMSTYYGVFSGPGVSENADTSWLDTYNTYQASNSYIFTVKCSVFRNSTNFTIDDILDQKNYRDYIIRRFTTSNGAALNAQKGNIAITEIKLSDGNGINGVTNTFASALWAIDIGLQFALFGGISIKFPIDLSAENYHSALGPGPTYTPNPIYYGMLFLTMLSYVNPAMGRPTIIPGLSSNIKAYGMQIANQLQIILINKDTNPNASGVVKITIKANDNIQCLYLSGGSLNATTNITWAGLSFIGGNSTPQGNYTVVSVIPAQDGVYNIPLAYAQAALCYLGNPDAGFPIDLTPNSEPFIAAFLFMIILLGLF